MVKNKIRKIATLTKKVELIRAKNVNALIVKFNKAKATKKYVIEKKTIITEVIIRKIGN